MSLIETEEISLDEIYQLALSVFSNHGCNTDNANALARTVTNAERDGSLSHGLFRIPGSCKKYDPRTCVAESIFAAYSK